MDRWACAIEGCLSAFPDVESVLAHQRDEHAAHTCRICGEEVNAGFFAIRHAFEEHTRAEYVRHYDGDADAIRWRERVANAVGEALNASADA